MRLLVFGAAGQLGSELLGMAAAAGHDATGLTRTQCDITDAAAVEGAVAAQRPDAVINCAAWTAVDPAEDHPDAARLANAVGPGYVASACQNHEVRCCHISTDYVFGDGATEPIAEDAATNPLSTYGRTKLDGERAVAAACRDHLIVRTSWVYGHHGPNFVLMVLRLIERGQSPLRMVADQRGSPTWTGHLAPALLRLLTAARPGTYHLGGSGVASRYDQACEIVAAAGAEVEVLPASSEQFPARAVRPRYSALDNRAWRALGEKDLPDWRFGVRDYLATMGRLAS